MYHPILKDRDFPATSHVSFLGGVDVSVFSSLLLGRLWSRIPNAIHLKFANPEFWSGKVFLQRMLL